MAPGQKNGPQSIGKSRGEWTAKIHLVAADARTAIAFSLPPGQAHDAEEGRKLLNSLDAENLKVVSVIMDKAYKGNQPRQLVFDLGLIPVVPPKENRISIWQYDREMYKKHNEVKRLFRRLKGFRRIFSRLEKLDAVFRFFVNFALIVDRLISVNRP